MESLISDSNHRQRHLALWKKKNPTYIFNEFEEIKKIIFGKERKRARSIEYGGDEIQKATKETAVRTTTKKAMQCSAEGKIDMKQKVTTVKEHFANNKQGISPAFLGVY